MQTLRIFIVSIGIIFTQPNVVGNTTAWGGESLLSVIVLDLEIVGDTSIASLKQSDQALVKKYSNELRRQLDERQLFDVIADEQTMADLNLAASKQYLHRCNGCELTFAQEHGATHVIVPWVDRMSVLIQTLIVEIRDVDTQSLILRKTYNFRGNSDQAWQHAIQYFLRDLQK